MKKLLIIRHAQAADPRQVSDFDRPLTNLGTQDALTLGKRLLKEGIGVEVIYTSPALRAKTTAGIIATELGLANPEQIATIYEAPQSAILKAINNLPNKYNCVSLTGHNPGLSEILVYLTGKYYNMHTCAAALISFEVDSWQEISADSGKVTWFNAPSN